MAKREEAVDGASLSLSSRFRLKTLSSLSLSRHWVSKGQSCVESVSREREREGERGVEEATRGSERGPF